MKEGAKTAPPDKPEAQATQIIHEALIAERQAAETHNAQQRMSKDKKIIIRPTDLKSVPPKVASLRSGRPRTVIKPVPEVKPAAHMISLKPKIIASAPARAPKPRSVSAGSKPVHEKTIIKSVAEKPQVEVAEKTKPVAIVSAEKKAPTKDIKAKVPLQQASPIEFEPVAIAEVEAPAEPIIATPPELVLAHSETGLQFVRPQQEDDIDLDFGETMLQEARADLGITAPVAEKPVDMFEMPETSIVEQIQPKTVEVISVIKGKVNDLESEKAEIVEVLLVDLQEVIAAIDEQSEQVAIDAMTKILDTLEIAYDEEIVAEIIIFLRAKQQHKSTNRQLGTVLQRFEEGTHEKIAQVTSLLHDVKDFLEPLHVRLGRTALGQGTFERAIFA